MLRLVPTPIGNLEDITFRALKALKEADILLAEDTRVIKRLLHLLSQKYGTEFNPKKILSFHEHNQHRFLENIEPSFFDSSVVYVSDAGMPGISDPGSELVRYAQTHGIPYEVLPGPSAAIAAFVASGYEGEFTFFAFLPHKGEQRAVKLKEVLSHPYHSILYEAPHRLLKLLKEIRDIDENRELFLAKELTKKYERFYKGGAGELYERLKDENIKGEWVVVITPAKKEADIEAILKLDIPKKEKAKMLAKVTDKSIKEWYKSLI